MQFQIFRGNVLDTADERPLTSFDLPRDAETLRAVTFQLAQMLCKNRATNAVRFYCFDEVGSDQYSKKIIDAMVATGKLTRKDRHIGKLEVEALDCLESEVFVGLTMFVLVLGSWDFAVSIENWGGNIAITHHGECFVFEDGVGPAYFTFETSGIAKFVKIRPSQRRWWREGQDKGSGMLDLEN